VERADQRAVAHGQLVFQLAQRDAKDVMLHGHVGQEAVAEQMAGQHPRGPRADRAPTARAGLLFQLVLDHLAASRWRRQARNQAGPRAVSRASN